MMICLSSEVLGPEMHHAVVAICLSFRDITAFVTRHHFMFSLLTCEIMYVGQVLRLHTADIIGSTCIISGSGGIVNPITPGPR